MSVAELEKILKENISELNKSVIFVDRIEMFAMKEAIKELIDTKNNFWILLAFQGARNYQRC